MDSMTSFSKDMCEIDIKFYKKMSRWYLLWVIFNFSILAIDIHNLWYKPSTVSAMCVGAMAITLLWSLLFWLEIRSDLKSAQLRHIFLTDLYEKQVSSAENKLFIETRKMYEQMIQTHKKMGTGDVN